MIVTNSSIASSPVSPSSGPATTHVTLPIGFVVDLLNLLLGFRSSQTAPLRACPLTRKQQRCSGLVTRMSLKASPAELTVRNIDGGEAGKASLALQIADPAKSTGLVHRYIVTIRQNARQGSANTKTRAEVRGGGRKPYAQKGTGNARQGSRTTPLKPGGGVIFGPKPKDYTIKMNKKERRLALSTALQSAAEAITVVEDLKEHIKEPKTKLVTGAMSRLGVDPEEYVLLVVDELSEALSLATRNIERLTVNRASALNAYDICRADRIIMESSALKFIQQFYSRDAEEAAAA